MLDLQMMRTIMQPWKNAQQPMNDVRRWGNFPNYGQTLSMHNNSVPWPVMYVIDIVREFEELDIEMLLRAFLAHDHGEPLTGGDEHHNAKTTYKDVMEWIAFYRLVEDYPSELRDRLLRNFSLQFCRKESRHDLPKLGRKLVKQLRKSHPREALLFDFCERFDYLFTALDGYDREIENDDEWMLDHCFGNHASKLDGLVQEWSVLGSVWTPKLRSELGRLVIN